MLKRLLFSFSFLCSFSVFFAQRIQTDTIINRSLAPIYNAPLFGDSLVSSFCIEIKSEVKEHKHALHSEHVYVVSGEAEMNLNDKKFTIKKGDLIFIPKNTWHAVKVLGKEPLKVLSIQAPAFDGKDRIMR